MILGNQVEWVLHCMSVLASIPSDVWLPAKVLAEYHGVPKEFLSKALQALAQKGLVQTALGPRGGYRLSRPPHQINLLEIVEAVEGKHKTFNCQEIRFNNPCLKKSEKKTSRNCVIASIMYQADEAWRAVLKQQTLSDVVNAVTTNVPHDHLERSQEWLLARSHKA